MGGGWGNEESFSDYVLYGEGDFLSDGYLT